MNWMICILLGVAIGAAIFAIYERRSARKTTSNSRYDPHRSPERAAYINAEMIRAEAGISNPPQSGGFF